MSPTPPAATPDISSETPELYAGSDEGRGQLGNGESYGNIGTAVNYGNQDTTTDADRIVVGGTWTDEGQYLVSKTPGHVILDFSARDVYLVAGPDSGPVHVTVTVDGNPVPAAQRGPDLTATGLQVGSQRLYHVLQGRGRRSPLPRHRRARRLPALHLHLRLT